MMHADDSLQHLLGRLCRPGAKAQELLETFDELLRRNAVGAAERRAVRRSLEAQGRHLDVAEFLSAWKCAAGAGTLEMKYRCCVCMCVCKGKL